MQHGGWAAEWMLHLYRTGRPGARGSMPAQSHRQLKAAQDHGCSWCSQWKKQWAQVEAGSSLALWPLVSHTGSVGRGREPGTQRARRCWEPTGHYISLQLGRGAGFSGGQSQGQTPQLSERSDPVCEHWREHSLSVRLRHPPGTE